MIPLPPDDPALPALPLALNAEGMRDLLRRVLPECASEEFQLEACRPSYVRYKPRTNCLVAYELRLRDAGTGATVETLAHAKLYSDQRGAELWSGGALHRLVERAARRHPIPPLARAAYAPDLRAVVQLFPVDVWLRELVYAASTKKVNRVLQAASPHGAPLVLEPRSPALVRYKPARKALLRYAAVGRSLRAVYGKLHADSRGSLLLHTGRTLAASGVPTPVPLAYLPELRLLLHPEAPGRRLADLAGSAEYAAWMAPAAGVLARLHACQVAGLPLHSLHDEVQTLLAAGRTVGALLPSRAEEVESLAAAIASDLAALPEVRPTSTHGDFYDDQLLVSAAGPVLIDLDEVRLSDPRLDIGNFLAHVSLRAAEAESDPGAAFLEACSARQPALVEHVTLFEAAAVLKLAVGPFRWLESNWPNELERRVCVARQRLDEYRQRRRPISNGHAGYLNDPALPQLPALTDPSLMARQFQGLYRTPTDVLGVTVVRHKPGQRCTLEYELRVGDSNGERRQRIYGKSFANERGARVFEVTRAIAATRACGPDVTLPQPLAYLPHLKLLLLRQVPGEPVAARLLRGDCHLARRVAEALGALHAADLDLPRRHDLSREIEPLEARVQQLSSACPSLEAPALRCLALVRRGSRRALPWRWRPVHRDFYHDQVLVHERGLSILDFDDAAMSEPAVDVANFLAHLRLLGLQEVGRPDALAEVACACAQRAQQLDPDLDPSLLRFLDGATLLRLAAIHLPRSRGVWLAGRLLEESERLLAPAAPDGQIALGPAIAPPVETGARESAG